MKILLFGCNGQVGWEAQRTLACLGDVVALDQGQVDFLHPEKLKSIVADIKPDVIVNAAAYTAVDKAESEPEIARMINAVAPGELAAQARKINSTFIHFSTDYVYDGTKGSPYSENDGTNPINVYGQTKLDGDRAIEQVGGEYLIFRTSWVYSMRGDSFVRKVLSWARQNETLRIVDDQVGSPTWARMLAETTALVLAKGKDVVRENAGLYHLAGEGSASRFEWAKLILELDPNREEQKVKELETVKTSEFPTPARRPLFTALGCDKIIKVFGVQLPNWETILSMVMGS